MREWWSRLRMAIRRRNLDEDLRAEIDSHLQMEVDARVDGGMSPTEAMNGARRQFGNGVLQPALQRQTTATFMRGLSMWNTASPTGYRSPATMKTGR